MSYDISLVSEQHGYEIRLEKRTYTKQTETGKSVENAETVACLGIIDSRKVALEVFEALDAFLIVCEEKQIISKGVFRHGYFKEANT